MLQCGRAISHVSICDLFFSIMQFKFLSVCGFAFVWAIYFPITMQSNNAAMKSLSHSFDCKEVQLIQQRMEGKKAVLHLFHLKSTYRV